jgi:hypothetical protein
MMKIQTITFLALLAAACSVSAQTADQLKTQLATVNQQILTLRQNLYQSTAWQQLQQDAANTAKAYNDALSNDQGMTDINTQIATLQEQMRTLVQKRNDKQAALDATTLATAKAAKDAAEQKLRDAKQSGALGQALQQRGQLVATLNGAQITQPAK